MNNIQSAKIRIAVDAQSFDSPIDVIRGTVPQMWRSNDSQFEIGVFFGETLLSISNFSRITVEVRKLTKDGKCPDINVSSLMFKSTTELDDTVTKTTWDNGLGQHAVLSFSAEETALIPGDYWLSIWSMTTDTPAKIITLSAGIIKILETGGGVPYAPPEPIEEYYSAVECDDLFVNKDKISTDVGLGYSDIDIPSQKAVKSYVDTSANSTTCSNIGAGIGKIFAQKNDNILQLKSIKAGNNITLINDEDDITISAAGGGGSGSWAKIYESTATTQSSAFVEFTDVFNPQYTKYKIYFWFSQVRGGSNDRCRLCLQLGSRGSVPTYYTAKQSTFAFSSKVNNQLNGEPASGNGLLNYGINNSHKMLDILGHLVSGSVDAQQPGMWIGFMDITLDNNDWNAWISMQKQHNSEYGQVVEFWGHLHSWEQRIGGFKVYDHLAGNLIGEGTKIVVYGIEG